MAIEFDFNEAVKALREGNDLNGAKGILTPLIKQMTEAAMRAELEEHLEQDPDPNRKNGYTAKTMKSPSGEFELNTPRDRAGRFVSKLVKKNQTHLTDELERKILALFAQGMSYQGIRDHVQEMYGMHLANGTLSAITDKLIPELNAWRERPLDPIYPVLWLDAIFYKIKEHGRFVSKAVYTILGITIEGQKELLGIYLSDTEGSHYWLSVLTDLQNRGVRDVFIACVDGLKGFPEAIETIFPHTQIQQCIVHQIRHSMKYVASKHQKAFMVDLKPVYRATTKVAAEMALDELDNKWGQQYPLVIKSWRNKWDNLSIYFQYPDYVRKVIYTTNAVEAVHRQFRQLTKTKGGFANENALLKLLYAGIQKASEKWSMPVRNWSLVVSQMAIHFKGRLDHVLDI